MSATGFLKASVSKVLFYSTAVSSILSLRYGGHAGLDISRVLSSGQIHSLLTSHFPFSTTSEMVLGLIFLYELRKFERMMGSEKFGAFLFFSATVATSLLSGLSLILQLNPVPGPYALIYSFIVLHHVYVPVTSPHMLTVFGVSFSEKAIFYLTALPLALSSGIDSLLPTACGFIAGCLYVTDVGGVQAWRLPQPVERFFQRLGPLVATPPPAPPRPRRGAGGGSRGGDGSGIRGADSLARQETRAPERELPPPSEEDILNLMGMGFEREQVVAALTSSGNSVQIAAERLLGSS